jgi:hypothetical protein
MFSLAVTVRKLRPLVVNLLLLSWIAYWCIRLVTTGGFSTWKNDPTLLQLALQILDEVHQQLRVILMEGSAQFDVILPSFIIPTLKKYHPWN